MTNAHTTITTGQERMASAIARRLGHPVTFLHWHTPGAGRPESPVFAVPVHCLDRAQWLAGELGLNPWQFTATK